MASQPFQETNSAIPGAIQSKFSLGTSELESTVGHLLPNMNYHHYSDETLLKLIAEDDPYAFEELYERHTQTVHSLVLRIVKHRTVADEVVQESFWQAWQKAGDFKGRGAGAAWLCRIARNKSIDYVRKQKKAPVLVEAAAREHGDEQSGSNNPIEQESFQASAFQESVVEQKVGQHMDRQQLTKAMLAIPTEQRKCLEMAYFEGYSQSQISKQLDVPLGTVKTRVRMGLEKLEQILRAVGYNEDNF